MFRKNATQLDFNLDFYTDVLNLEYLIDVLDAAPLMKKFKKLNSALVGLIEDYSLVCFIPMDVGSDRSLLQVKNAVDKVSCFSWTYENFVVNYFSYRQMDMFMGAVRSEAFKLCYLVQLAHGQKVNDLILILCNKYFSNTSFIPIWTTVQQFTAINYLFF